MNLCWRKILVSPVFTFFFCRSFSYIQVILKWTLANKSIHIIISENFLQRKGPIECGWGYDNQNAFKKFLNRPEFSLFCFDHPLSQMLYVALKASFWFADKDDQRKAETTVKPTTFHCNEWNYTRRTAIFSTGLQRKCTTSSPNFQYTALCSPSTLLHLLQETNIFLLFFQRSLSLHLSSFRFSSSLLWGEWWCLWWSSSRSPLQSNYLWTD